MQSPTVDSCLYNHCILQSKQFEKNNLFYTIISKIPRYQTQSVTKETFEIYHLRG